MQNTDTDERPAKRKKVAAACEVCRTRKVRCDGSRPSCQPCRARGSASGCHYTAHNATYDQSRERYIEELQDRLRRFEHSSTSSPTAAVAQQHLQTLSSVQTPTGLSSSDQLLSHTISPRDFSYSPSIAYPNHQSVEGLVPENVPQLPPKHVGDHLLNVYWDYLHWMYPVMDRQTFQASYEALWNGVDLKCDRRLFICSINAIFACSVQVLNESDAARTSDTYFKRARKQLDLDLLGNWSVQLVQTLILCTQYLQSADEPQRCKSFCTLAVRTAQGVGLHLPSTSEAVSDPVQKQVLRRLWHCCVIYDKVVALSLSQPPMLSPSDSETVPLPEETPGTPFVAFIRSIPLYHRLHVVLLTFYNSFKTDTGSLPALNMTEFLSHEAYFAEWENSLPKNLQFDVQTTKSKSFADNMISSFLQCRYVQIRIVFLRPALSIILQQSDEPTSKLATKSVKSASLMAASVACFESAKAMLANISDRIQASRPGRPCSIWWLDVYFAYTAATVVLASKFTPSVSQNLDPAEVNLAVQHYTSIFEHHSQQHRAAARCLTALTKISARAGSTHDDKIKRYIGPAAVRPDGDHVNETERNDVESPLQRDLTKGTADTNHSLVQPDLLPSTDSVIVGGDANASLQSSAPITTSSALGQQQQGPPLHQTDTLDFAAWLATAPLDFESSDWSDWLVDLDARYPDYDFGDFG